MKKHQHTIGVSGKAIFIALALFITSFSVAVLAAQEKSTDSISMTYSFSTPMISKITIDHDVYDQIILKESPCSGNPGEPSLPTKGAYLLLPPHTKVDTITITGEKTKVGTGLRIVPCSRPIPIVPNAPVVTPSPDTTIYSSEEMFPGCLYTQTGVYHFRGYTILVLMLHPVQYVPATGDVFYYPTMDVSVTVTKDIQENSLFRDMPQDLSEVLTKADNPAVAETYQGLLPHPASLEQYDLLILTTDALKNGFEPLAAAHNSTGVKTIIRTLSDVGGSTPENIRDYIRTAYTTEGISYVLLGGDTDVVPEKMLYVEGMDENVTKYSTEMPVDLYYACLDGPYNFDGDTQWGEPNDGENGSDVDLIAEVYVGRACVGTINEVNNFVQKTVSYLSLPPVKSYIGEATFAGEYLGDYGIASFGGTTLDQLINGSSDDGYTTVGIPASKFIIDKLHDEDYPGFDPDDPGNTGWPKEEIINRINNGVHLINHDGHANYVYNMRMDTGDVNDLTNNDKFCFVYSQGCMSGGFDNPEGGDCIAEYFTAKNTHGAFAGIWNARYGFFWSFRTDGDSQRYMRQFWDAVFGENKTELGRANHDSKEDNLFMIQRSCMRWCYYETNLFGDPSITFQIPSGKPHLTIATVKGGLKVVSAEIINEGNMTTTHVAWSMTIRGGLFGRINLSATGSVETLASGDSITVQPDNDTVFGLGKVIISVTAKYAEPWTGTAFVLGPIILKPTQT